MKYIRAKNRSRRQRQRKDILRLLFKYNSKPHNTRILYQDLYFYTPPKILFPTPYGYVGSLYYPQIRLTAGTQIYVTNAKKLSSSPLVKPDLSSSLLVIDLRGEFTQSTFSESISLRSRLPEIVLALRYWADHVNWPKRRAEVTLKDKLSEIATPLPPIIKNPSYEETVAIKKDSNAQALLAFFSKN